MAEAVVVGVRVRPFNGREKELNATLCIDMQGPTTIITDDNGEPQQFAFDQSFWSHDGFEDDGTGYMRALPGGRYSDQQYVFDTFGQRVLDNAWAGYHCCLFAYGQTGAGKSYSMVGYGNNKGIVPISCEEIFKRIGSNTDPNKRYEVMISMLEIYNETVQDLFIKFDQRPKNGLQIRESKALGIYVDGIIKNAVDSYASIERSIDEGTSNRSVGSTAMNATSSRAHTVITIEFKQIDVIEGKECVKLSNINLVDLAGSEKAGQTGAKGDRLKEGSAINKSLSALGNVIEKLAERSSNPKKAKDIVIPYRDSKLTRLLQNALGGSSKTIMICALSPASSNYEETLSTLRYADRAKKIKNVVVVNENPQEKLVREMKEENAKLKAMLESAGVIAPGEGGAFAFPEGGGIMPAEVQAQKEQIAKLQEELAQQQKSFAEKVAETQARSDSGRRATISKGKALDTGHLIMINLNPEFQLSGKIRYTFVNNSTSTVGGHEEENERKKKEKDSSSENSDSDSSSTDSDDDTPDVLLASEGVYRKHALIQNTDRRCFLRSEDVDAAKSTWINGKSLEELVTNQWKRGRHDHWEAVQGQVKGRGEEYHEDDPEGVLLHHGDRIVFGKGIFLFVDPSMELPEMMVMLGKYSYNKARKELPDDWKDVISAGGGRGLKQVLEAVKAKMITERVGRRFLSLGSKGAGQSALGEEESKGKKLSRKGSEISDKAEESDDSMTSVPTHANRAEMEAKDKEIAELKEKLAASEKAAEEAKAAEAKERKEREMLEAEKKFNEERNTQEKDNRLRKLVESERDAKEELAIAEQLRGVAAAKARLEESMIRLQGAMAVARSLGADSSVVADADMRLEKMQKNITMTEKLQERLATATKDHALEFRIDIQKARGIHGMPVDKTLIARAEERLEALMAS